jgi:hypothetical protein
MQIPITGEWELPVPNKMQVLAVIRAFMGNPAHKIPDHNSYSISKICYL